MIDRNHPVWGTAFEFLPERLERFFLPFDIIDLTRDDLQTIGAATPGSSSDAGSRGFTDDFIHDLEVIISGYPKGAHVRLGLCSFKKDTALYPIKNAQGALNMIMLPNRRVASIVQYYVASGIDASLFVFPWHNTPIWGEFRLFVYQASLVGVSQYRHGPIYEEIEQHCSEIVNVIQDFCENFIDLLHLKNVVIDIFVDKKSDGNFTANIIELNPFIHRTDPCLFTWKNGGDFDRTFRFRKSIKNPYRDTTFQTVRQVDLGIFREIDYSASASIF